MDDRLDIRMALRVFEKVRQNGEPQEYEHFWQGIHAGSDFEGYTLTLRDQHVTLTLLFHNKYAFDYQHAHQLEAFIEKIRKIDAQKSAK